ERHRRPLHVRARDRKRNRGAHSAGDRRGQSARGAAYGAYRHGDDVRHFRLRRRSDLPWRASDRIAVHPRPRGAGDRDSSPRLHRFFPALRHLAGGDRQRPARLQDCLHSHARLYRRALGDRIGRGLCAGTRAGRSRDCARACDTHGRRRILACGRRQPRRRGNDPVCLLHAREPPARGGDDLTRPHCESSPFPLYVRRLCPLRKNKETIMIRALAVLALAIFSANPWAQAYPNKPIRLVVGFTPGGVSDVLARALSARLSQNLGQQVVVDNRPGAGTTIASEIVARSAPDGYTLYFCDATTHAINASLYGKLPYDSVKDFTFISLVASTPLLLVVNPALPAKTVPELIALAKARAGQLNYASSGTGTIVHLAGETFKSMAGVDLLHVPYKGSAPATVAVIAGDVAFIFSTMPAALPHVKSGRLRALAVTTPARVAAVQDIPTIAEAALPGFDLVLYSGVVGPAGMPKEVVERLNGELVKVVNSPEITEFFAAQGATPIASTPEQFAAHMRSDIVKLGKMVKASGAKAD